MFLNWDLGETVNHHYLQNSRKFLKKYFVVFDNEFKTSREYE